MYYQMRRDRDVTHYLYTLGESGRVLREFINALKTDPYPEWAIFFPEDNLYELCVENHIVLYEAQDEVEPREVLILSVEPY